MYYILDKFLDRLETLRIMAKESPYAMDEKFEGNLNFLLSRITTYKLLKFQKELSNTGQELPGDETEIEIEIDIDELGLELEKEVESNSIAKKYFYDLKFKYNEDGKIEFNTGNNAFLSYVLNLIKNDEYRYEIHKETIIHNSIIINLCSYLESFISNIMHDFYLELYRGDLKDNKTITFKELKDIGSIDDALVYLVDKELQGLFMKQFSEWLGEIMNYIRIKELFKGYNINDRIDSISELYLRRNLLVHSESIVNDLYLRALPSSIQPEFKKGDIVRLTESYILKRISDIETIALMIFYSYIKKKETSTINIFNRFNSVLIDRIRTSSSPQASIIYKMFANDMDITNEDRMMAKVNYFLCYKLSGELEKVDKEFQEFDISGCDIKFVRAKKIIAEEAEVTEEVIEHFKSISDSTFLMEFNWPLYDIIREKSLFSTYTKKRFDDILTSDEDVGGN